MTARKKPIETDTTNFEKSLKGLVKNGIPVIILRDNERGLAVAYDPNPNVDSPVGVILYDGNDVGCEINWYTLKELEPNYTVEVVIAPEKMREFTQLVAKMGGKIRG